MSWIDKIKDDFVITCGDGKIFRPSWLNASFKKGYNISEFEFPNVDGTLVKRTRPLGRQYALEIRFQGADHLDEARAFERSADDPRPWIIFHPFYNTIIVQPTELLFDNTVLNISKITGTIIETIVEDNPRTVLSPVDAIAIAKNYVDSTLVNSITAKYTPVDVATVTATNKRNYNLSVPIITIPSEFESYNYAFNQANSAVNTAIASPLLATRYTLALINKPALFTADTKLRVGVLTDQFNKLRLGLSNVATVSAKQIYQLSGGGLLSSMAQAASISSGNKKASDVLSMMQSINGSFQLFMGDLDGLQSSNGGNTTSFIPNAQALIALNNLMNLAIANLFKIALGSKQERSIITEADTNFIILAHRLYGLDPSDENINELIEENGLGLNSLLQVKKNTKIIYYI